jgi:multidrug efflux pump subunit AcrA (membrane-fusion protein)
VATGEARRGTYVDVLEIRGEVRAVRTTIVQAPRDVGELRILKLARSGTEVTKGEVVAEFDAVTMRRTISAKESELRSAEAELEQAAAQSSITLEERAAAVRKAEFDVERARLALGASDAGGGVEIVSAIEAERARLSLSDAEQRLLEAQAAFETARTGIESERRAREDRLEKIKADLDRAKRSVTALAVTAPSDGTVSVMPNSRSASFLGPRREYQAGDTTYAGATILELPDLSSVDLVARLDEADRGPIRRGQPASVRAEAVAGRDFRAAVTDISLLARTDFTEGWPPSKLFDLTLRIEDAGGQLRPGMSAEARIEVGQIPDALMVPSEAVFTVDGRTIVFVERAGLFEAEPVAVLGRGRDDAVIEGRVQEGDRVALVRPDLEADETEGGA